LQIRSFIRSDITNETLPVGFVISGIVVPPDQTDGIPAQAQFNIAAKFPIDPPNVSGMALEKFRREFIAFTFLFEGDGKTYTHEYSRKEVEERIDSYVRRLDERHSVPGVKRKAP
jgi:hypothetical protein